MLPDSRTSLFVGRVSQNTLHVREDPALRAAAVNHVRSHQISPRLETGTRSTSVPIKQAGLYDTTGRRANQTTTFSASRMIRRIRSIKWSATDRVWSVHSHHSVASGSACCASCSASDSFRRNLFS
jgi:hypothetical protein